MPQRISSTRTARKENTFRVDGKGVNDSIMSGEVMDELSIGTFPLLNIVSSSTGTGEAIFCRMYSERPNGLLVVSEGRHRLARCEVPEADSTVHRPGDDLRVGFLTFDVGDGSRMTAQDVDLSFGAHIPDLQGLIRT